jgi:hypothetical protein
MMEEKSKLKELFQKVVAAIISLAAIAFGLFSQRHSSDLKYLNLGYREIISSQASELILANKKIKQYEKTIAGLSVVVDSLGKEKTTIGLLSDSLLIANEQLNLKINEVETLLLEDTAYIDLPDDKQLELFLRWTQP